MAQDRRSRGLRDSAHCGSSRRGGAANRPLSDHFSPVARDYARFRPRYPEALFEWLAGKVERRDLAWDCGTGNGQTALALAKHFARVIATDRSDAQEAGYRTIEFPFAEIVAPAFEMSAEWTAAELCGYLGTWSATRACIEGAGGDPVRALEAELVRQGGDGRRYRVEWPLALRVGWAGTEKAGPPEGGPAVSLPRSD